MSTKLTTFLGIASVFPNIRQRARSSRPRPIPSNFGLRVIGRKNSGLWAYYRYSTLREDQLIASWSGAATPVIPHATGYAPIKSHSGFGELKGAQGESA